MVRAFAWVLRRTLGTGGPLGLAAAANVFVGMTEAPLLIRPYLAGLTSAELFALMTSGMATVAGTVMFLYAGILGTAIPDAMGHILIASLISAPAALLIAGLLVPEREPNQDPDAVPRRQPAAPWTPSPAAPWTPSRCGSTSSPCWSSWSPWWHRQPVWGCCPTWPAPP